jgi:predicted flavoprotein YhiN
MRQTRKNYFPTIAATLPPPQAGASVGGLKTDDIKTKFYSRKKRGGIYIC